MRLRESAGGVPAANDASPAPAVAADAVLATHIANIAAGDIVALESLYALTAPFVNAMARSVLRCPHDAEEIVSEVFIFIWDKACRYDPRRGSVMGWITIITRHRAIDKIRKRRRTVSLDDAPGNPWLEMPTADSERPEYPLSQSQDARELHRVLDNLSPLRRQIMLLAFIQGQAHVKIAAATGLPLGTVKSHIRRTLKDMQSMLGPQLCVMS